MREQFGEKVNRVEVSPHRHFMYWDAKKVKRYRSRNLSWTAPTTIDSWTFDEWAAHQGLLPVSNMHINATADSWVYLFANSRIHPWLLEEMTFFDPDHPSNASEFFLVEPELSKGVQCRIAQRGTISQAHFDENHNMVAVVRGLKRYVLLHPSQCSKNIASPLGNIPNPLQDLFAMP